MRAASYSPRAPSGSAEREELRRNMTDLLQTVQPVFFFENAELVALDLAQERMINAGHDLSRDHGAAIFARKQRGCVGEEFVRPLRLEFHQREELRVAFSGEQLGFGI